MISAVAAAVSGLAASEAELEASASNVANAQSAGPLQSATWGPAVSTGSAAPTPLAQAYQPIAAVQSATADGGVAVGFSKVSPAAEPAYDPEAPFANADGLVAEPNVDLNQETVDQMSALSTFQANLATLKVADEMQKSLLAIA